MGENNEFNEDMAEHDKKSGLSQIKLTPHLCPVCGGKGIVPNGFYIIPAGTPNNYILTGTGPEPCRSCVNGIILV